MELFMIAVHFKLDECYQHMLSKSSHAKATNVHVHRCQLFWNFFRPLWFLIT